MKKIITILALIACSMWAEATTANYYTNTGLTTTTITANSSGTYSSSNDYTFSSQVVDSSAYLTVVSSGNADDGGGGGSSFVWILYSTTGCSALNTTFGDYESSIVWSDNYDTVGIGAMNLSNLCVRLYASATYDDNTSTSVTATIVPSSIYVTATTTSGNHLIWWITKNGGTEVFQFNMNPYISKMREKYGVSIG
jgi:hypothetical protein